MKPNFPRRDTDVVLVEPTHPGNVGAVARAMNNMGFERLRLVNPCDHLGPEARPLAADSEHILESATLHPSLEAAVADRQWVIATTARPRSHSERITPLPEIHGIVPSDHLRTAIVFGRESSGLTNAELALCNEVVFIPTPGPKASLNLAQAVAVTLYEISRRAEAPDSGDPTHPSTSGLAPAPPTSAQSPLPLASTEEVEGLKHHLFDVLETVGFFRPTMRDVSERSLADLVGRAKPTVRDVQMIRGFLHRVEITIQQNQNPRG